LWIARKRAGYPQKRVAILLGNRSLSVISEYEKGRKLPSLRAALKLELVYQTPLAELFPALYGEVAEEVRAAKEQYPSLRQRDEMYSAGAAATGEGRSAQVAGTVLSVASHPAQTC
jgi:transcriptional regulator with XRE-family HTH domain